MHDVKSADHTDMSALGARVGGWVVEVRCVGGPHDGWRLDVVPGIVEIPPLLITVEGARYVRVPDYGKA